MDYRMHEGTYERFLVMVKWGTISVAILMVILYFLIIA
ncbi:aa3-type cytochrome c oxidase subunit IV [Arsenicitalea aurantiaca]|uniref:Aa3-type cytochrome c oxidase subunit IV n=2 Tax=Arsenicitalea aurantiaca TaxID=1783274 RepID=A0A433XM59_9HYPH|nr:aa3-type cytochrome c oxidase subunit IV [Arsenicitalea aurantiaca]